ncbi:DNA polymerase zeta catalytic subunit isoform X2 [Toxorhynchites rutilus septentrionalis]|uniref:DNA polymerase zeta catalytic subunit isoform X2 n=1 Tax=Toxorhynchites rutilus septentrionalis TaxID=329112 RepID=UPI00247A1926|nr:DNA polymerase zeta catalytic subunit isoform X2 [Toxorhynchites rutilus septentrionalis]
MVRTEDVTSIRIVSVDHYMHKPEPQFDTCYSEFRGSDVKQVPVIRLFGSTSDGVHCCVHIHGVFPYIYVPYDGNMSNTSAVDVLMYQIASSLDKAINISLGKANSPVSHVFRIALVKGVPIYGYHRKEHQFFKIYLYNPHFTRKATNLLMNGVIMSRVFQTFETHVPYILQFFIDYNLYGMSFLRVSDHAIRERDGSNDMPQKMSTSEYEIDILASDIHNRNSVEEEKRSEYANPGIASIWDDEKARRECLGMEQPQALSQSQSGKVEIVTDSDRFYRSLLASKLACEGKVSKPAEGEVRRIKPPVSFYPSEADDEDHLMEASFVQNHKQQACQYTSFNQSNSVYDFDESVIDEERIVSMSQNPNASFADEDHALLDVMRELEENENNDVDGDSLLAPLSQPSQKIVLSAGESGISQSQSASKRMNVTLSGLIMGNDNVEEQEQRVDEDALDSDDEFLLDYTMKLDAHAEVSGIGVEGNALLNDSNDDILAIPQLDGAHSDLPTLTTKRTRENGSLATVSVNGVQTNGHEPLRKRLRHSKELKQQNGHGPKKRVLTNGSISASLSPRASKQIKLGQSKSVGTLTNGAPKNNEMPPLKEAKVRLSKIDLSSYRLPPRESPIKDSKRDSSPYDEFRLAREYDIANNWDPQEGLSRISAPKRRGRPKKNKPRGGGWKIPKRPPTPEPEPEIDVVLSQNFQNIIKLSPKVLLKPLSEQQMKDLKPERNGKTNGAIETIDISSGSEVVLVTDEESRSSASQKTHELPEISQDASQIESFSPQHNRLPIDGSPMVVTDSVEDEEDEDDLRIKSFYEPTLTFDDFDEMGSETDESMVEPLKFPMAEKDPKAIITLKENPPSMEDALRALQEFQIPQVVNQEPFYSNPADVTGRKEVGNVVLHIAGNNLNDMEEFKSVVSGLGSINQARYEKLRLVYGESLNQILGESHSRVSSGRIKELLASERAVIIHPAAKPPTKHEAKVWLKAVGSIKADEAAIEQDSPIKIKKMQAIMSGELTDDAKPRNKIDPESTLNLSSLITDDYEQGGSERKTLVSQIFSMNTKHSPGSASPAVFTASGADRLELLSYSARRKRRKHSKARLSLSVAFKRLKESTRTEEKSMAIDEVSSQSIEPGQQEEIKDDAVNASQITDQSNLSQSPNVTASNQTTIPHSAEVASMKERLLCEGHPQLDNTGNISATTPNNNTYGFKVNYENLQQAKATCEYNYLTIMSVEVHVQTRADLRPNPAIDPISAIFYRIHNDVPEGHRRAPSVCGIILNHEHRTADSERSDPFTYNNCSYSADVVTVPNERELYEKFLTLISFWDPDIFAGYEIEQASWGFVIQRGYVLEMNLMKMLSRVPTAEKVQVSEEEEQDLLEMHEYSAGLKIPGRILLDIWRLMRHEIALTSYSFENITYHILHRRVPRHSFRHLTRLWNKSYSKWIVLEYYLERVNGNLELLQQLDLIGRTAELAKLFGIQFYEVLSRGSQFRVESMMLRIAKPRNFVSVSPSIQQRAHMRSPEYLPLILEPNSRFYADPLIVLDFQSLYPSMIIAYNYCFSTCLGRVEHLGQAEPFEFGACHLRLSPRMLKALVEKNLITVSPCGVVFAKSSVREGILPRMLNEILMTRLMVKASMKLHKTNSALQRVLHSRQLGLKLIANVTYGYTAANFSGRMPCVEVGDSVVSKGRETLERAIKMVEATERWGAKVVYGDTDSLFVLCPGRTKEDAFKIGEEIADAVTKDNPPPVKLKLEKVYQPSILQNAWSDCTQQYALSSRNRRDQAAGAKRTKLQNKQSKRCIETKFSTAEQFIREWGPRIISISG